MKKRSFFSGLGYDSSLTNNIDGMLKKGSTGDEVRRLQSILMSLGYDLGSCGADGIFGNKTLAAVNAFQSSHNLVVDGIVGPKTWGQLTDSYTSKNVSIHVVGERSEKPRREEDKSSDEERNKPQLSPVTIKAWDEMNQSLSSEGNFIDPGIADFYNDMFIKLNGGPIDRETLWDYIDGISMGELGTSFKLSKDVLTESEKFPGVIKSFFKSESKAKSIEKNAIKEEGIATKGVIKAPISQMSNEQLVQEIATRANNKIGGTGSVAGTLKHSYAKELLDRYQSIFGYRGLETETSWLRRNSAKYGTKGSARIDVLDTINNTAYDYKFTINPGRGLSQSQINKIFSNGPNYLQYVKEVNP
ncbi:peptidoglycan-binding protein [Clostridium sp. 19966]|uniref:peptidoglycan-binding domain-containing protein n=1 Tax=Clostridium sp. 19966 TaxID=2768166 RepID=UPI0028DE1BFB|nr:peptidoglycan-binding domain-containing protein [Clostridium sp. 19966]MDT8717968.1 peptidoglycan-binding protein [Clostridium sp. 19966]